MGTGRGEMGQGQRGREMQRDEGDGSCEMGAGRGEMGQGGRCREMREMQKGFEMREMQKVFEMREMRYWGFFQFLFSFGYKPDGLKKG
ncbi:hypothetical protein MRB53_033069 [Persea americana]|uniref:Uncharacterized protein n=1 Tax=Persea americana TaxID=3435 RepID=A0ACC2KUT2_PERAE|nr:hypothetical protein MRB53_033069 [Persea americana]